MKTLLEIYKTKIFGTTELSLVNNETVLDQLHASCYGGHEHGTLIYLGDLTNTQAYEQAENLLLSYGLNPINPARWYADSNERNKELLQMFITRRCLYVMSVYCNSLYIKDYSASDDLGQLLLAVAEAHLYLDVLQTEQDLADTVADCPF